MFCYEQVFFVFNTRRPFFSYRTIRLFDELFRHYNIKFAFFSNMFIFFKLFGLIFFVVKLNIRWQRSEVELIKLGNL